MKRTFIFLLIVMISSQLTFAQKSGTVWPMKGLVRCYFAQPIDASFAVDGNVAIQTPNAILDSVAGYISRAKKTVDICQYEYETFSGDQIGPALNAAAARGVKIRYIDDYSQTSAGNNTGVTALSSSIYKETSPSSASGITHNKFVIVDETYYDSTKAFVVTGSPDWDKDMNTGDYNNIIIFQSKQLAKAYTSEFNIMWGDTTHGAAANTSLAKFGSAKPSWGSQHAFNIGGSIVDLYFSPTDGVETNVIQPTIASANIDCYCGMFTFSESTAATDLVNQKTAGATVYAILDQYSSGGEAAYSTLQTDLGAHFADNPSSSSYIYHNKYLIVNPSAPCDDPKVLTGSHNWTSSANSDNDENTVVVHNDTIARFYLQSFAGDFKTLKPATLATVADPCGTLGVKELSIADGGISIYPNPAAEGTTVYLNINPLVKLNNATLTMYNVMGDKRYESPVSNQHNIINCSAQAKGMYFYQLVNDGSVIKTGKLLIQ
jgi:phosphatidylserine/phosphatidylglycerophosphate/cardiolipin synthase-like enzyme